MRIFFSSFQSVPRESGIRFLFLLAQRLAFPPPSCFWVGLNFHAPVSIFLQMPVCPLTSPIPFRLDGNHLLASPLGKPPPEPCVAGPNLPLFCQRMAADTLFRYAALSKLFFPPRTRGLPLFHGNLIYFFRGHVLFPSFSFLVRHFHPNTLLSFPF